MSGLEDGITAVEDQVQPRASLILGADEARGIHASLWMGGARSVRGQVIDGTTVLTSVIVDCAGELPRGMREQAAAWQACVFVDHDGPIPARWRIDATARAAAERMTAADSGISDVYVMCTHGMNRSGLVAGLILRELGFSGDEAVRMILEARPGALSNLAFRTILGAGG